MPQKERSLPSVRVDEITWQALQRLLKRRGQPQERRGGGYGWSEFARDMILKEEAALRGREYVSPQEQSIRDAAEWILSLHPSVRVKLAEMAESLQWLYERREAGDAAVQTRLGRVLNIFQAGSKRSKKNRGA